LTEQTLSLSHNYNKHNGGGNPPTKDIYANNQRSTWCTSVHTDILGNVLGTSVHNERGAIMKITVIDISNEAQVLKPYVTPLGITVLS
jgi:hypothetical protein